MDLRNHYQLIVNELIEQGDIENAERMVSNCFGSGIITEAHEYAQQNFLSHFVIS